MWSPADPLRIREFSAGMPDGLRGFVELFITHTATLPGAMREAVASRDPAALRALAHRSIGSVAACGAVRLTQLLRDLEASAKGARLDAAETQIAELDAELTRVHAFLRALADGTEEAPRP